MFKRRLVSQLSERLMEPRRFIQIVVGPRQNTKDYELVVYCQAALGRG